MLSPAWIYEAVKAITLSVGGGHGMNPRKGVTFYRIVVGRHRRLVRQQLVGTTHT
jgi:hypothetical protein